MDARTYVYMEDSHTTVKTQIGLHLNVMKVGVRTRESLENVLIDMMICFFVCVGAASVT